MKPESFPYYKPTEIRRILSEHNANPKKSWGQNYLIDPNIIEPLFVDISEQIPSNTETLAEIGMGLGALTHKILDLGKPTFLLEIDPVSCKIFREGLGSSYENWQLMEGDCRDHLSTLAGKHPFVFGNLPYYITSEIITDCLEKIPDLTGFLFLVQKEFGERIVNEISSLSVFIRGFGNVRKSKLVKKGSFYPAPKIDSLFLFFETYRHPILANSREIAYFSAMLRACFWGKRKKIATSLRDCPEAMFPKEVFQNNETVQKWKQKFLSVAIEEGFSEKRPEELPISLWLDLTSKFISTLEN